MVCYSDLGPVIHLTWQPPKTERENHPHRNLYRQTKTTIISATRTDRPRPPSSLQPVTVLPNMSNYGAELTLEEDLNERKLELHDEINTLRQQRKDALVMARESRSQNRPGRLRSQWIKYCLTYLYSRESEDSTGAKR